MVRIMLRKLTVVQPANTFLKYFKRNFHGQVHRNLPQEPTLRPYFFKIHFNITPHVTVRHSNAHLWRELLCSSLQSCALDNH